MPKENPLVNEMINRLEHLRKLPHTSFRNREILGLERAIEKAKEENIQATVPSSSSISSSSGKKTVSVRKRAKATQSKVKEAPRRRVEHKNGKRRVIISAKKIDINKEKELEEKERLSREEKMRDIRSMLGISHRGMS